MGTGDFSGLFPELSRRVNCTIDTESTEGEDAELGQDWCLHIVYLFDFGLTARSDLNAFPLTRATRSDPNEDVERYLCTGFA